MHPTVAVGGGAGPPAVTCADVLEALGGVRDIHADGRDPFVEQVQWVPSDPPRAVVSALAKEASAAAANAAAALAAAPPPPPARRAGLPPPGAASGAACDYSPDELDVLAIFFTFCKVM